MARVIDVLERRGSYLISTDKTRLDVDLIHRWLSTESYWAIGRTRDVVERSIANAICFGIYDGDAQVGFARVITDEATFAWLGDVFVVEAYRGRGLSKWLVETIVAQPALRDLRLFVLGTRDAHGLYQRYGGFEPLHAPERWLARVKSS